MLQRFSLVPAWQENTDRFGTERSNFDFVTLTFNDPDKESTGRTHTHSTISREDVVLRHHKQAGVAPSQSLLKKSMNLRSSITSTRKSITSFSASSSIDGNSSLKGIPMAELATADVKVIGRDKEHQKLLELYKDPNTKMTTVVGPSGVGKSVVALQLRDTIEKNDGVVVCSGKFDVQNRADPYQAFVEAIASFVDQVLSNKERCEELGALLNQTIGEEMDILEQLVPSIAMLLQQESNGSLVGVPENPTRKIENNPNAKNTRRSSTKKKGKVADRSITERAARIQNVLVEFVKLASTKEYPLMMLLDDIQWASSASLGLIEALLEEEQLEHFFLLATCRDAYLKNTNASFPGAISSIEKPYPELIELLDQYSQQSAKLFLEPLSMDSVQELINILLRIDDENKTRHLAEIVYRKTAGNPFFVLQFMNVLVDDGLLTFNVATFEWNWIVGDIMSQNVATNVAEAVYKRLNKIPPEDLLALQIVSAIGKSFEVSMVQFVVDGLRKAFLGSDFTDIVWPTDLHWSFDSLVNMGILETRFGWGEYDFSHDQIQSAAFRLIPDDRKAVLQLAIGKRLIEGLDSSHRDQFLFPAVELCMAGMGLMGLPEKQNFAFWAFVAGDAALKQGAFDSALRCLDVSIEALGENPFQKDEELSIPLFCGALEAAFTLNMNDKVDNYLQIVLSQLQIPLVKRSRAALVQIKSLATRHKFDECNAYICERFEELGAGKISPRAGLLSAVFELKRTYRMVSNYTQKELLDLPLCTDPNISMAVDMVKAGITSLYLGNPPLFIILTCKGLQLSLKHGISASTPMTMSCIGILVAGIQKDYDKACELGESGLAICEKHRLKKVLPQVVAQTFAFIRHYKRPMQQYVAPLRYAMDVGMRMGVMEDLSLLKGMFCCMVNATGATALPKALPEMERYLRNIKHQGHIDQWLHSVTSVQFAHILSRPHRDNTTLDGDLMNEKEMFDLVRSRKENVVLGFLNNYKVQLLVHFGDPLDAIPHGEESAQMGIAYGVGTPFISRFQFFVGLANLRAYEKTKKRKHWRTARTMKNRLKELAKKNNPNVLHFLWMLRAEMTRVGSRKEDVALNQLNEAAVSARRMGSLIDHAFANELRACFYLDPRCQSFDEEQAAYYMRQAVRSYQEYGAETKVLHLQQKYSDLLLAHPPTQ